MNISLNISPVYHFKFFVLLIKPLVFTALDSLLQETLVAMMPSCHCRMQHHLHKHTILHNFLSFIFS